MRTESRWFGVLFPILVILLLVMLIVAVAAGAYRSLNPTPRNVCVTISSEQTSVSDCEVVGERANARTEPELVPALQG